MNIIWGMVEDEKPDPYLIKDGDSDLAVFFASIDFIKNG
jgi:hypothetical protein